MAIPITRVGADVGFDVQSSFSEIPLNLSLRLDNPYSTGLILNFPDSLSTLVRKKLKYAPNPDDTFHLVLQEETLWSIAFQHYQNSKLYWIIQDVNNLENSWELEVGKTLLIPDLIKLRMQS